jgi:hypothetical protein
MASRAAERIPTLFPPDRKDCQKAIALAILRLRSNGWSREALGVELGVSADTIDNASNERGLLSFDSVALLAFKFPDEFRLVEAIWSARALAPLTLAERLDRVDGDLAAIRREVA